MYNAMKKLISTIVLCSAALLVSAQKTTTPPLVYSVEHTGAGFPKPTMPTIDKLPVQKNLPDALQGVSSFKDWTRRRSEIAAMIQHYGIG